MLGKLLSSGIVGLLFGFGFSPMPAAVQYLHFLTRFAIAFAGAFAGTFVAMMFGVSSTSGIDWLSLFINIVIGYLVALLVIAALDRIAPSNG